ncbi:hypothetical protein [Microbacterium sp.]
MMRALWVGLVLAVVATIAFAPSGEPARPEPGARRIIAAVFGVKP